MTGSLPLCRRPKHTRTPQRTRYSPVLVHPTSSFTAVKVQRRLDLGLAHGERLTCEDRIGFFAGVGLFSFEVCYTLCCACVFSESHLFFGIGNPGCFKSHMHGPSRRSHVTLRSRTSNQDIQDPHDDQQSASSCILQFCIPASRSGFMTPCGSCGGSWPLRLDRRHPKRHEVSRLQGGQQQEEISRG